MQELLKHDPSTIALVDGYFHQVPAVGHQELRRLIEAGWQVWGLSSLGAIRAFELREFGVKGFGVVFEWFCAHPEFRDDEVALMHLPIAPFEPISEPLIHMRFGLADLVSRGKLTADQQSAVLEHMEALWYGHRTLAEIERVLRIVTDGSSVEWTRDWLTDFDQYRVKSSDLSSFLRETPWRTTAL
jgi:hypothetical protein